MRLSWLWRWWRRPPQRQLLHVVMFTRKGCHLCETAWQRLKARQHVHGFRLDAVDVDGDPALAVRFGNEVPVVTMDGKVRFRGEVNEVLLDRLLNAKSTGRRKKN
jgi:hypothetical protein